MIEEKMNGNEFVKGKFKAKRQTKMRLVFLKTKENKEKKMKKEVKDACSVKKCQNTEKLKSE